LQSVACRFSLERAQHSEPLRFAPAAFGRKGIDDAAAAKCPLRGLVAEYDTIAMKSADRLLQDQLRQTVTAGCDGTRLKYGDAAADIGSADMDMNRRPVLQRLGLGRQNLQSHVQARSRRVRRLGDNPVAALNIVFFELQPGEIERATLAAATADGKLILRVYAAHPHSYARRRNDQPVAGRDLPRKHGAGHNDADAGQREATIDREAKFSAGRVRIRQLGGGLAQMPVQRLDSRAGDR